MRLPWLSADSGGLTVGRGLQGAEPRESLPAHSPSVNLRGRLRSLHSAVYAPGGVRSAPRPTYALRID
jgi:hypothetical protein